MSAVRRFALPCAVAVATLVGAGCGDDGGSTDAFCADVEANATAMMNPAFTTQADVEAYLQLHAEIGEQVPLAIEDDWLVYVGALESAASVVPGDAAAAEEARRAVYAAEESSFRVLDWVRANCGVDLAAAGPVARLDPSVTTTLPPTTTTVRTASTASTAATSTTAAPTTVAG